MVSNRELESNVVFILTAVKFWNELFRIGYNHCVQVAVYVVLAKKRPMSFWKSPLLKREPPMAYWRKKMKRCICWINALFMYWSIHYGFKSLSFWIKV